jgi:hypothetical protein
LAGIHRQLAGQLQIVATRCGTLVFKEALRSLLPATQIREDKSMRNVAFSIMLSALALLQIAVVLAALSPSRVQGTAVGTTEVDAEHVLAASETKRKASFL